MVMSKRSLIKQDLLDQLERNCTTGKYYVDLVDDYMELWNAKNLLIKDIKKRGATVEYVSNNGTINQKKNESISEFAKINLQMIKLLAAMGISPSQAGDDNDEM